VTNKIQEHYLNSYHSWKIENIMKGRLVKFKEIMNLSETLFSCW